MLVLLSFGLVLIATVLLVLGLLVGDGLSLIYASIALSAVAAVILFVAVRVSKPKVAQAAGPAPLVPDREPEPEYATAGAPATTTMPAVAPVAALYQIRSALPSLFRSAVNITFQFRFVNNEPDAVGTPPFISQ